MPTIKLKAFTLLERVRAQSPVVHHLTNWVTIYDCAQVVALGARHPAVMSAVTAAADVMAAARALRETIIS